MPAQQGGAPVLARHRELRSVHHSRKGLSAPLALRGVDGVSLDVSASDVSAHLAEGVLSKEPVSALEDVSAELTIALQGLPRMEKTAAALRVFAVLLTWSPGEIPAEAGSWAEYGRTEVVQHGTAPRFTRSFVLKLAEEASGAPTRCRVHVYSRVGASLSLQDQVSLGMHEFTLSELYHVPGRTEKKKLPGDTGSLTVRMSPIETDDYLVSIAVSGIGFRCNEEYSKDKGSLPDLFFQLLRGGKGDVANVEACYRSETLWQTEAPLWEPFELTLHKLCTGELEHMLVFEVYDWNSEGDHTLLGSVHMTASRLVASKVADGGIKLLAPEGGGGDQVENLPAGQLQITGDMRMQLKHDAAAPRHTVYYSDVGDDAKQEDGRFLAGLLSDEGVKRSGLREVVDEGMRAVAERDFYMSQFLNNRATVQSEHSRSRSAHAQFANAFDPVSLLSPTKGKAELPPVRSRSTGLQHNERDSLSQPPFPSAAAHGAAASRARSRTPTMLKRNRCVHVVYLRALACSGVISRVARVARYTSAGWYMHMSDFAHPSNPRRAITVVQASQNAPLVWWCVRTGYAARGPRFCE
jgi:hypothetical protein